MKIERDIKIAEEVELPSHVKRRIRETFGHDLTADQVVTQIIRNVRENGDAALFEYSEKLDGAVISKFEVTAEEIEAAKNSVDEALLASLEIAADRIRTFHQKQISALPIGKTDFGEGVGQVLGPLERVGVYAPGGKASYPSTVLMTAIPAKVAGVDEVILASPPRPDGHIPSLTLAAAAIAGVDRLFAIGGASAVAALAFGTDSVPKVDKICGPGNIFVMLAKKQVFGVVGVDGLQGPTETIVLADGSANPVSCAADLLAQAEHDEMASAIMITDSAELGEKVSDEVAQQMARLPRSEIVNSSMAQHGGIHVVGSMQEAIEAVNDYAPEHLCLLVENPDEIVGKIRHSGGIFVGESSPEVMGDYVAGPSHVMPTGGTARFSSPLNVLDFLKVTSLVALDERSFNELAPHAAAIARAEGLTAHEQAVYKRFNK